jgi:hypothetical protein
MAEVKVHCGRMMRSDRGMRDGEAKEISAATRRGARGDERYGGVAARGCR